MAGGAGAQTTFTDNACTLLLEDHAGGSCPVDGDYFFTFDSTVAGGQTGGSTIANLNTFKRNPGVAGLAL